MILIVRQLIIKVDLHTWGTIYMCWSKRWFSKIWSKFAKTSHNYVPYVCIYLKKLFWVQKVCQKNLLSYKYDILYVETKISDRNFCGIRFFADFPANFPKFQIFLEQPIFIVRKGLLYEKTSIFNEKYDASILKWFT